MGEENRVARSTDLMKNMSDDSLVKILTQVDLLDVASRLGNGNPANGLDCVMDWSNTLSLGEQQRLAFARILTNRPRLIILDESTSALDVESEEKMYGILKDLGSSVSYVSVGHRPTLLVHHDRRLRLDRSNSTYSLEDIEPNE